MSAEQIDRWQRAEAALDRPRAAGRAAEKLPGRLGWLLRALSCLDEGRPEEVEALAAEARAAGQGEIAAVLEVAAIPPDELDPTAVRRAAKKQGLGEGMGLPYLDLLRLYAARLAGARTTKSGALLSAERRRDRATLRAVNHMLSTTSDRSYFRTTVRKLSPRAEQVIVCSHFLESYAADGRRFLERNFAQVLLDLSPERYPDLQPGGGDQLALWRTGGPFTLSQQQVMALPVARRRALLSSLLLGLYERTCSGRLADLVNPANAACHIAGTLREHDLQDLAHTLHLKLEWLDPHLETPAELLEAALERWPEDRALRDQIGAEAVEWEEIPPKLLAPALLHAATLPDLVESSALLESLALDLGPGAAAWRGLDRALEADGASPWRRSWARVVQAMAWEECERALGLLPPLVADAPSLGPVIASFQRALSELRPRQQRRRETQHTVAAFLEALAGRAGAGEHDLKVWEPLLFRGLGECPWPESGRRVAAALAARDPAGLPPQQQIALLAAAVVAGLPERRDALVTQLGRQLMRTRPQAAALALGLTWVGAIYDAGLQSEATAPLERSLLKQDAGALGQALAALPETAPIPGAVAWWRAHPQLGPLPDALQVRLRAELLKPLGPLPPGEAAMMEPLLDQLIDTLGSGDGPEAAEALLEELMYNLSGEIPF